MKHDPINTGKSDYFFVACNRRDPQVFQLPNGTKEVFLRKAEYFNVEQWSKVIAKNP